MEFHHRRLLVLGGSGTLGGPLTIQAVAQGWDVFATYLNHPERIRAGQPVRLDLRDETALHALVEAIAPDVIIHAAITERSGAGYADAIRLSAQHVSRAALVQGARLIALSTDLVFDGTRTLYDETTPPAPGDDYGHAKADYERLILADMPSALVVRTSLIYDFDDSNAQVAWMVKAIGRGEPVCLYTNEWRCPVWAVNLADALLELAEMPVTGLLHVTGPDLVSRYTLGTMLLTALGYDIRRHVVASQAAGSRPRRLHLSIQRAQSILQRTRLLSLQDALAHWRVQE